jgi:hypothetical protein
MCALLDVNGDLCRTKVELETKRRLMEMARSGVISRWLFRYILFFAHTDATNFLPKYAGFGLRPMVTTHPLVDAVVWVKPGGESDGTTDTSSSRFDTACTSPASYVPSPEAGDWHPVSSSSGLPNHIITDISCRKCFDYWSNRPTHHSDRCIEFEAAHFRCSRYCIFMHSRSRIFTHGCYLCNGQ